MTPGQFLDWERLQDERWEFDGHRPVAMNGGTIEHATITANILTALTNRLRGSPCRPLGPTTKVQTGPGYRYPNALVTCTRAPRGTDIALEPRVLFEVMSPSTEVTDVTTKLLEYRGIASVQRYVVLSQDAAMATVYCRTANQWTVTQLLAGEMLSMPEIGIEIPVSELYADVELPEPTTASSPGS